MILNFSNPENNIKHLNLKEGSVVADFGSGSGHYVLPLADIVGEGGKVYAIDIQKSLLTKLQKDVVQKGFQNVETVWGDAEILNGSKLRNGTLDAVIVSNILFQVESKSGLIKECNRVLKKDGKVLLVDWSESFGGLGPQPDSVVSADVARELFEKGGFTFKESVQVGNHHYGIIFSKS